MSIYILIYLQFPSLFAPHNVSKCEIKYKWVWEDYISWLQTSLFLFIVNATAKMKY